MRWGLRAVGVLLVMVLAGRGNAVEEGYRSRALNPGHLLELQRGIDECQRQVEKAPDADTRSAWQEELCKRLIQAEDYDWALESAKEVFGTPGANEERKAAHHFLIAQIYALRMEASPSLARMEENRQAAIRCAGEVVSTRYPKKWMVRESAQQLLRSLEDPTRIREIRAWVEKRERNGRDPAKQAAASAQTRHLERSVAAGARVAAAEPVRAAIESRLGSKEAYSEVGRISGNASVSFSRTGAASEAGRSGYGSANRASGVLRQPIVIDGVNVRPAEKAHVPSIANPYAPGAAPEIATSKYGFDEKTGVQRGGKASLRT
jgi:hypothetical protein